MLRRLPSPLRESYRARYRALAQPLSWPPALPPRRSDPLVLPTSPPAQDAGKPQREATL